MKKILLLTSAFIISAGIMAQSTKQYAPKPVKIELNQTKILDVNKTNNENSYSTNKISRAGNNLIEFGKAFNLYTLLLTEQNCLNYNKDANLISFTARSLDNGGNDIIVHYSTDNGSTFKNMKMYEGAAHTDTIARYPTGAIFNPENSADLSKVYAISAGPVNKSSKWIGGYYASKTFADNNPSLKFTMDSDTNGTTIPLNKFPRHYMQVRGNKAFLLGDNTIDNAAANAYTRNNATVNIGTWNNTTNSYDWTLVSVAPNFAITPNTTSDLDGFHAKSLAFDKTAANGYLVFTGRDATTTTDPFTYKPIVFHSTDSGLTWNKINFDWESQVGNTDIDSVLKEKEPKRPFYGPIKDSYVDNKGNLHIISFIDHASSNHIDSLKYIWPYKYVEGWMYDSYYIKNEDKWSTKFIEVIHGKQPGVNSTPISPNTKDAVRYSERMQASVSEDGAKVIYAWTDSYYTATPADSMFNIKPNVFVKMYDVATNTFGETHNVTKDTDISEMAGFLFEGKTLIDKGDYFQVPIVVSDLPVKSDNNVTLYYLKEVNINKDNGDIHIGINEAKSIENTIRMYPNPTSDEINIAFNEEAKGEYKITIYNAIGSVMLNENINVNNSVVRTINLNNIPSGIYLVQISNKNSVTTKKIVKN